MPSNHESVLWTVQVTGKKTGVSKQYVFRTREAARMFHQTAHDKRKGSYVFAPKRAQWGPEQ
jgi:hypothetical protein